MLVIRAKPGTDPGVHKLYWRTINRWLQV